VFIFFLLNFTSCLYRKSNPIHVTTAFVYILSVYVVIFEVCLEQFVLSCMHVTTGYCFSDNMQDLYDDYYLKESNLYGFDFKTLINCQFVMFYIYFRKLLIVVNLIRTCSS